MTDICCDKEMVKVFSTVDGVVTYCDICGSLGIWIYPFTKSNNYRMFRKADNRYKGGHKGLVSIEEQGKEKKKALAKKEKETNKGEVK